MQHVPSTGKPTDKQEEGDESEESDQLQDDATDAPPAVVRSGKSAHSGSVSDPGFGATDRG